MRKSLGRPTTLNCDGGLIHPVRLLPLWPALAAVAAFVAGCDDTTGPGTLPECVGPVNLVVEPSPTPVIRWTPACRVFLVLVEDPGGDGDEWGVLSDSSNAIAPPVTYGIVPHGASKELGSPMPLQAGHEYHVGVRRFTGPGHEDGELIGQTTFTP